MRVTLNAGRPRQLHERHHNLPSVQRIWDTTNKNGGYHSRRSESAPAWRLVNFNKQRYQVTAAIGHAPITTRVTVTDYHHPPQYNNQPSEHHSPTILPTHRQHTVFWTETPQVGNPCLGAPFDQGRTTELSAVADFHRNSWGQTEQSGGAAERRSSGHDREDNTPLNTRVLSSAGSQGDDRASAKEKMDDDAKMYVTSCGP
jgi:hypothetical protein